MRRMIIVVALLAALPALADADHWAERDICRAAVKTYFFLGTMPADAADQGEYFGFVSAKGNVYTCQVAGDRAVFAWLTKSDELMRSEVTRFRVSDGVLTIKTDMSTKTFEK